MKPQCYNNNRNNNTERRPRIFLRSEQNLKKFYAGRKIGDYCFVMFIKTIPYYNEMLLGRKLT